MSVELLHIREQLEHIARDYIAMGIRSGSSVRVYLSKTDSGHRYCSLHPTSSLDPCIMTVNIEPVGYLLAYSDRDRDRE